MFGHQDNQKDDQLSNDQPTVATTPDISSGDTSTITADAPSAPVPDWPEPTVTHGQMLPTAQPISSSDGNSASAEPDKPASPATPISKDSGDLLDIKQQALQQLSPLVSHLDQSPEEKFRTLMMMIQAADDQSLINSAYEAANAITDEKAKAQALLDVINEINYFTHPHEA